MLKSRKENQLDDYEMDDLRDCVNDIVIHITDGNKIESEVTAVMGGEIYELHSDRIIREATEPLIQQLADKDKAISDKDKEISDKDKEISDKNKEISDRDKKISEAENRASMLEQELEKERKKLQILEQKLREADGK